MSATLLRPKTLEATPRPSRAVLAIDARACGAFAPPPKINLADWIEENVSLPADVSDTPGLMTLFPYQRGIAEACDNPEVDRVVWMKCARVGATSLGVAITASFVVNNPSNVMWVQPTQDDARDFVVSTVEPIFAASPPLAGLLVQDEKKRDTIQSRRFPGGSAKFVGAAPRNMRRHFIHKLFLDEIDGYPVSPEGDIVTLAINRTRTARDRLIFMASTPTDAETSRIAREYEASNKQVYEIQCPECSEFFELRWEHIKWDKTEDGQHLPETAHAVCPHHGCVIEETSKGAAVEAGRWRATAPHVRDIAGFKSSALISSIEHARWPQIVVEFLEAKKSRELLRVWANTLMGETFHDTSGEGLSESVLQARAEPFGLEEAMPADVRILTLGVDVQGWGLECLTVGHSATQMFVLDYRTMHGAPTGEEVWQELDAFTKRRFAHPLGGTLGFDAVGIDEGDGNMTDDIRAFARPRFSRRIVTVKGMDGVRPPIERSSKPGLYIVGSSSMKSRLYGLMEKEGHIRFSQNLPPRFWNEVTAERLVTFYKSGQPRRRWERIKGLRAEGLDCLVYAAAIRGIVGTNLTTRENELRQIITAPKVPTVFKSKWMERGRE